MTLAHQEELQAAATSICGISVTGQAVRDTSACRTEYKRTCSMGCRIMGLLCTIWRSAMNCGLVRRKSSGPPPAAPAPAAGYARHIDPRQHAHTAHRARGALPRMQWVHLT